MNSIKSTCGIITGALLVISGWANTVYASDEQCDTETCRAQMDQLERYGHNGSPEALAITALAHATGFGMEKDEDRARVLMKESVRLDSSLGMYIKARWLTQGFIFPKDEERAEFFLRKSAQLGYEVANYEVAAKLLLQGEAHFEEGMEYLDAAVEAGYIPALYVQARFIEKGAQDQTDLAAAAAIYAEVGRHNHRDASQRLRNIIQTLENDTKVDDEVVAELREMRDMEVITIIGQEPGTENTLARINMQLNNLGVYDGYSTGSRLKRQRPCHLDSLCSIAYQQDGPNRPVSSGSLSAFFGQ